MENWKRNFAFVWLNNFITSVGMMAFIPLFPLYLRDVGIEDEAEVRLWSGVLVGAAPLAAAFMGPLWGALGDRVGRKLMLLRANFAIVVFVGLMGLARTPEQLLALRLAQGCFSGFMAPALTLVSVMTPDDRQGRVTGLLHTAVIAGGVVGPLAGGAIADQMGLRPVFLITAGLSAVAGFTTMAWVREAHELRAPGQGGFSAWALLQTAARDIVGFAREGPLRSILLVVFAVRFGAALVDPILVLFIETLEGYDPRLLATVTGLVFGVTMVATLVLTPVWGKLGDRSGAGRLLAICATGAGLAYLPQAFVGDVYALGALRFLSGAFLAGIFPAAYTMTARHSSRERRGSAYGFTFSSLILANALGPMVGGTLAAVIGLQALIVVGALLMLGAAARVMVLNGRWARASVAGSGAATPGAPAPRSEGSGAPR